MFILGRLFQMEEMKKPFTVHNKKVLTRETSISSKNRPMGIQNVQSMELFTLKKCRGRSEEGQCREEGI
jgi:hypothetical protein